MVSRYSLPINAGKSMWKKFKKGLSKIGSIAKGTIKGAIGGGWIGAITGGASSLKKEVEKDVGVSAKAKMTAFEQMKGTQWKQAGIFSGATGIIIIGAILFFLVSGKK